MNFSSQLCLLSDLIALTGRHKYKSQSSVVCNFLCPHVTLSVSGPNILLGTLLSVTSNAISP
jgi:hypothetical protein